MSIAPAHSALSVARAIFKTVIVLPVALPILCWSLIVFPISVPAWIFWEFWFGSSRGSGAHFVLNPWIWELRLRLASWVSCSAVAALYLYLAGFPSQKYFGFPPEQLLPLSLLLGFLAVQAPMLLLTPLSWILDSKHQRITSGDPAVTYRLKHVQIAEDMHVFRIRRHAKGDRSRQAGFVFFCETFYPEVELVTAEKEQVIVRTHLPAPLKRGLGAGSVQALCRVQFPRNGDPVHQVVA